MIDKKTGTLRCGENVWHVARHPSLCQDKENAMIWGSSLDLHDFVYRKKGIRSEGTQIVDNCIDDYDRLAIRFLLLSPRGESLATFRFLLASDQKIQVATVCPDEYRSLESLFGRQITEISGFCHPRNIGQDTTVPMLKAVYEFSFEYGTPCWTGIFDRTLPRLLGSRGIVFQVGNRPIQYRGKNRVFCWGVRGHMKKALERINIDMHGKIVGNG